MKRITLFFLAALLISGLAAYGQKIKTGNVLHNTELEITLPDKMTPEQFENLTLDEYIPAAVNNHTGMRFLLLKNNGC